jgi:hypothetical protein
MNDNLRQLIQLCFNKQTHNDYMTFYVISVLHRKFTLTTVLQLNFELLMSVDGVEKFIQSSERI